MEATATVGIADESSGEITSGRAVEADAPSTAFAGAEDTEREDDEDEDAPCTFNGVTRIGALAPIGSVDTRSRGGAGARGEERGAEPPCKMLGAGTAKSRLGVGGRETAVFLELLALSLETPRC